METTTETNTHNRELTPTEIKIAIAQIQDRLTRVAKAQEECSRLWMELVETSDEDFEEKREALLQEKCQYVRAKYDLPKSVHIFIGDMDAALSYSDVSDIMPYVSSFVKGKLSEKDWSNLQFYFEECAECDYGWILIESPLCFYDCKPDDGDKENHSIEAIIGEMKSIGTRSKAKNRKLPKIAGVFHLD